MRKVSRLHRIESIVILCANRSRRIDKVLAQLTRIEKGMKTMAGEIERLEAAVGPQVSVDVSIMSLVTQIAQMLKDCIAAGGSSADMLARVAAVAAALEANAGNVTEFVKANTPAAPTAKA